MPDHVVQMFFSANECYFGWGEQCAAVGLAARRAAAALPVGPGRRGLGGAGGGGRAAHPRVLD